MKISHRILILIVFNILALLGMAGSIFYLGETEQEFYEQSNIIIHMKSLFAEKQYMERMRLNNVPVIGKADSIDFQLKRYSSQINRNLLPQNIALYEKLEDLSANRAVLVAKVFLNHEHYLNRIAAINVEALWIENMTGRIIRETESELPFFGGSRRDYNDSYLHCRAMLVFLSHIDLSETALFSSEKEVDLLLNELREHLTELQSAAAPDEIAGIINELAEEEEKLYDMLAELRNFLSSTKEKQKELIDRLENMDDEIILLINNTINELNNSISIREDQEHYTILSGILLIMLISIWATALLGRSISRPIEQLRTYVHSIDLSNISLNPDRSIIDSIDAKKHLEIAQLAESYAVLEEALFDKMKELEDRSEKLSDELAERRKTERKLKQTERYLNNIIQSLNSLVITADSKMKLIHWNKLADKLSENDSENLFSRFPMLESFENKIKKVMENSQPWSDNSIELEPIKERYFNISLTPLAGRKTGGVVIRLDDITQIRNIENQLLETQKWETLGVLTSGFAHDFNNVLTGIVTSSSILLHMAERNYPDLDKTFVDCLSIIDRSGNRAAAMVQQLLSLSRSNELNFTSIDLRHSIEDVKSICGNSFDKSVKFILEISESRVMVRADNAQLEQIFLNLCINAYHAMTDMRDKKDKQGGELKITMKEAHIDQFSVFGDKGYKPGDYVAVSISDNGVGIPEDKQKKIFDPFFTTKDKSKGTGLGLTMVQHIINQHKGFLELYSEPGRGTVITVYLPLSTELQEEQPESPAKRELVKGKGTVLVIDDEEILRVLTESILKECGYKVLVAEDGFKGVDLYRKKGSAIDLVILDMSMPGISGKETFIELKQINPEVKILLASGFIKDDRIQDLLNLGLEDFIQKPFDFIELSERVGRILQGTLLEKE